MSNLGESLQLSLGFVGGPLQGYWQRGQESSFAATAKPAHALCLDGCIPGEMTSLCCGEHVLLQSDHQTAPPFA